MIISTLTISIIGIVVLFPLCFLALAFLYSTDLKYEDVPFKAKIKQIIRDKWKPLSSVAVVASFGISFFTDSISSIFPQIYSVYDDHYNVDYFIGNYCEEYNVYLPWGMFHKNILVNKSTHNLNYMVRHYYMKYDRKTLKRGDEVIKIIPHNSYIFQIPSYILEEPPTHISVPKNMNEGSRSYVVLRK